MLALLSLALAAPAAPPPDWETTIDRVVPAIVTIRVASPRNFDTDGASSSTATGFVVDAERGIVLTNRHVVNPGPSVAEAIFADHEEVPLRAIYRDPIHDFGFFQFDPKAVQFMAVSELELVPENARVGAEIRVVGSDNSEKISILAGTIARLDRRAPDYGNNRYNDFNTFYIQAASSTSGGSSGSPVLDIHGNVVALNAGSSRAAATSFYLPLDRVTRALALLQAEQPIPRGAWQVVLEHRTYDEVRRLGLLPATEARFRSEFPEGNGLLVVDEVVPGGPAEGKLRPGDVIVSVGGAPLNAFHPFEAALDDNVGRAVEVEVERGGVVHGFSIPVGDLHAITPAEYLEFGGGLVHPLSFQQARNHAVPVRGLYVAASGYALENAGIPVGAVLDRMDGTAVTTLSELESFLASKPEGAEVTVRYFHLDDPRRIQVTVLRLDRRWFPMQRCKRDDRTGGWPCVPSAPSPAEVPESAVGVTPLTAEDRPGRALAESLVWVQFTIPVRSEGVYGSRFAGTGIVVDAERGWIVVDRDTVPVALGDVRLVFGGSHAVAGDVVAIHPFHNLALVHYDPALLGDTPVRAVEFAAKSAERGDKVWHVGLAGAGEIATKDTRIVHHDPMFVPLPNPPFFRDANLQVYELDAAGRAGGGALTDARGRMVALFASFVDGSGEKPVAGFRGIPSEVVEQFLATIGNGTVAFRTLGAEVLENTLIRARQRGLPAAEIDALVREKPDQRTILEVRRLVAGAPAVGVLKEGDLLLDINGQPATEMADLDAASRAESVALRVFRDDAILTLQVPTYSHDALGLDRAVQWAGAVVHEAHHEIAAQRGFPATGLYVAWHWFGSPAQRYGLKGSLRILAVDDTPVPDLDQFLRAVGGRKNREPVRVQVVDLDGRESVLTLKVELDYWPTVEWRRGQSGWMRNTP